MIRDTSRFVAEAFTEAFGTSPEGVWSVPGRVSLMGDHTDIEDGLTLGFATKERTAVAISRRNDDKIRVRTDMTNDHVDTALPDLLPPSQHSWYDYPLGIIWSMLAHIAEINTERTQTEGDEAELFKPTGLDIFLTTDIQIGAGLASSASICGAVALAINDLWDLGLNNHKLAGFGYRVENVYIGASAGPADHVTCLCAEDGKAVFFDARGNDVSLIPVPDFAAAGISELLVYSGQTHRNWERTVAERHQACDRAAKHLGYQYLREIPAGEFERATDIVADDRRRANYILSEMSRVLDLARMFRTDEIGQIGQVLNASEGSIRDDFEATTERIDLICEIANAHGALGARMSGSGFGGAVYVLVPNDKADALAHDLTEAYREYGWEDLRVDSIHAAAGARRDS